ncbi:MAG: LysM peptidoglycan-binding domain-containing protein [Parvularculaceae bacterium]
MTGNAKSRAEAERRSSPRAKHTGVSKVESRIDVSDTAEPAVFYTVKSGDTLSKIAKAHYGDAMKYPAIFQSQQADAQDPDKIYPTGQVPAYSAGNPRPGRRRRRRRRFSRARADVRAIVQQEFLRADRDRRPLRGLTAIRAIARQELRTRKRRGLRAPSRYGSSARSS